MTAHSRQVVDSLTIRSLRNIPALPQAYNRTASDGLSAGDAATRAQALARVMSDSLTRDMIPSRTLVLARALTDARSQADVAVGSTLTLQQRINAASAGSTLDLTGLTFTANATINKALAIIGGTLIYSGTGAGLTITANSVTVGMTLTGPGTAAYLPNSAAIKIVGTSGSRRTGVVIDGCTMNGWSVGVDAFYTSGADIKNNTMLNLMYAGVELHSDLNSFVRTNSITDVGVGDPYGIYSLAHGGDAQYNCYGITATRDSGTDARSTGTTISGNTIDGVRNWHGIDTHNATGCSITGNNVYNTNRGIFLTGDGFGSQGTSNCTVTGNLISIGTPRPDTSVRPWNETGIYLSSSTTGNTVTGNTVDRFPSGYAVDDNGTGNTWTPNTVTNPT